MYCVQPLLPSFAREFHLRPATSSLAVSLTTGCLALSLLVVGALSEGWGRKRLMVTSLMLAALLTIVSAAAPSWRLFLFVRALEGVVFAGLPAIAMAYVGEEMRPRAVGLAMGIYVSGTALGGMAGRLLISALSDASSWRIALAIIGGIGVGAATVVAALLPASHHFVARHVAPSVSAKAYVSQLRDPVLATLYVEGFVFMGTMVAMYNYLGFRLLQPPYAFTQTGVGAIFLLYVVGMISSPWAGSLAHRFGRGRTLAINITLMLIGVALTLAESIALLATGVAVMTFGFFAAHSVTSSWVGLRAHERKAQASSLYLCCYYLGGSVMGATAGLFWEHGGWSGIAGFLIATLLVALATASVLASREWPLEPPASDVQASPAGA
jgi:MFS transporter, YNFM family, putative membrane transport protein